MRSYDVTTDENDINRQTITKIHIHPKNDKNLKRKIQKYKLLCSESFINT